jgi:cobyrinic acid a,c-diamide synthase
MKKSNLQLTYEEEVHILHFIQYCQGKSTKGDCRGYMYDVYKMFKNDGRNASVCSCLDGDTAKKVDGFISTYTFSDEIRLTEKFRQLLPHLALIKESAKEPLEEVSTVDTSEVTKMFTKAKSVPVKPKRKSTTKKK